MIITLSLFMSILFVKYRDLSNIWELGLQLIFYATPIVYSTAQLPSKLQYMENFNPLAAIVAGARNALISNKTGYTHIYLILLVITGIFYVLANKYFQSNVKRIAEYF